MADVQLENGYLRVAFDLASAIPQFGLSGLEHDILWIVMNLTYGAGVTKARISTYDIQYQLGRSNVRPYLVEQTIQRMLDKEILFRQELVGGGQILGLQKDYDRWMKKTCAKEGIYKPTNTSSLPQKTCTPAEEIIGFIEKTGGKLNDRFRLVELKRAKLLYNEVLTKTHSPEEAKQLLFDYIELMYQDPWVKANVNNPLAFMAKRFWRYYDSRPAKPRWVRENEEVTGKRFIWTPAKLNWYEGRRYDA